MLCLEVILSCCFFAMQPQFAMEKFYSILVLEPLYVIFFSIVETISVFFVFGPHCSEISQWKTVIHSFFPRFIVLGVQ